MSRSASSGSGVKGGEAKEPAIGRSIGEDEGRILRMVCDVDDSGRDSRDYEKEELCRSEVFSLEGVVVVDLQEELLTSSEPLWSAYIMGYFMGDDLHVGKVHTIVNMIFSFPNKIAKLMDNSLVPGLSCSLCGNGALQAYDHLDLTTVPWRVDLKGDPDHLFSHNVFTFFGDIMGKTIKIHLNTKHCVRLYVSRLLVVVNLEKPLPESISIHGKNVLADTMEKSSENVGVISNENSKLIDIDKSMPEVTNLSLTTDETTNQESVIVVNYVKQNVSPIRHSVVQSRASFNSIRRLNLPYGETIKTLMQ
ncbi:hypothetical protein N665_0162s0019 [Sinapis alba]|nr:hypothetical protein N665_0162s0019 [Sinapis alba]